MKKIFILLALLGAIGCTGNVPSQASGDPSATPSSQHDMTNDQLRNKLVKALDDMKAKAIEMGFEVGDDRDEVIRELKALGFDTERTIGIYPGSSWTIVDTEDVLGVNLNIKPKR